MAAPSGSSTFINNILRRGDGFAVLAVVHVSFVFAWFGLGLAWFGVFRVLCKSLCFPFVLLGLALVWPWFGLGLAWVWSAGAVGVQPPVLSYHNSDRSPSVMGSCPFP